MRQRYLVTFFALAIGPVPSACAVELAEGLTLNGFGEALLFVEHQDPGFPLKATADPRDETLIDVAADIDLKLVYRIDDFRLRADLVVADQPVYAGDNVLLEQAFVDWFANDAVTVRAGRFQTNWFGWEAYHTPDLWRVRHSLAWIWQTFDHGTGAARPIVFLSDGVGIKLAAPGGWTFEAFVVEDVLGDGPEQRGHDLAYGVSIAWKGEDFGRVELGLVYDANSMAVDAVTSDDGAAADLNVDITALEHVGWFFAAQLQYHVHGDFQLAGRSSVGDGVVALAMANYAFTPAISLTGMIDFVERGLDTSETEAIEYALALLTRPHAQVRLNTEIFFWDERVAEADAWGGAAALIVILP